jgi:PAS domain S-box-containing protein
MASRLKAVWSRHLLQIQLITSESAEGVIMIDVNQEIKWANSAALAMHGVQSHGDLGRTIDEYHANFQIKFRGAPPPSSDRAVESVASGESFRDVIIEVTPLRGSRPEWVYRVRNLVLVDDAGHPTCIVLVIRPLQDPSCASTVFSARLDELRNAAALVRCDDQTFVSANDAFLTLTGLNPALLREHSANDTELLAGLAALGQGHQASAPSVSLVSLAGGESRLAIARVPVEHANQRCILYTAVDIQLHDAARMPAGPVSRAGEAALCASSPVPLYVLDHAMAVTAVSPAWLDWLAYGLEEVLGRDITAFMTPASAEHFRSHTWQNFAHNPRVRDLKCDFVTKSGATVRAMVSAAARLDEDGRPAQVIAAPVDITERARSEDAFSAMFALAPVPMLIRKLEDNRILDANDAFLATTGFDAGSVIGHGTDEFGIFDARSARQQFEAGARSDDGVKNMDGHLKTGHGDVLDCLISARKLHAFGQTCLLIVLQDISDRRRNETQLFQAIETVMEDTSWFSRSVIEKLATLRSPPRGGGRAAEIDDLTPREREVLGFISHGLADTDIAQKLGLTRSTVRNHVATLYSKIGVHSRSSAIIWARERGINMAWPAAPAASYARAPLTSGKSGAVAMVPKNRRA